MTAVPFHVPYLGFVVSGRCDLDAIPEPEELAPDTRAGMVKVIAWMVLEWDLAGKDELPVSIDYASIDALPAVLLRLLSSHLIVLHATYARGPST